MTKLTKFDFNYKNKK